MHICSNFQIEKKNELHFEILINDFDRLISWSIFQRIIYITNVIFRTILNAQSDLSFSISAGFSLPSTLSSCICRAESGSALIWRK